MLDWTVLTVMTVFTVICGVIDAVLERREKKNGIQR